MPAAAGSDFPPGTWIGRYVVLQSLGHGGMGAVYAAYDPELDRRVAIKFLHDRDDEDPDVWRARLTREAKAMARVSHPNVVTVYDVGVTAEGQIFLAMEIVEGGTLGDWLKAGKRTWREIVEIFCEAGEGLAAAHRAGMIHRDFKLDNVLFGKDGRPRVTDFGLARGAADPPVPDVPAGSPPPPVSSASSLEKVTVTGTVLGTPGYMAPEQYLRGVDVDVRADVFAFCATLHRALYGERAFDGATIDEIATATAAGKVREAPKGTDVPAWVRRVMLAGLAPKPEDRPASMQELLDALRADPGKRRRRWLVGAAVVALACVAVLGVRASGERKVRACQAMAARLGGAWDAPRKGAIEQAFHATGVTYADDTFARVAKRLDAYAAGWTAAMAGACEATKVRGEQSAAMLDLRASCLDARLDELRALSDVFAAADKKTVEDAVQAASALPSIDPCSDLDGLSASTRLPTEPKARAEIRALQGEIASANELRVTGKQTPSWERLQQLHDRVTAAGYVPLSIAWTMSAAADDVGRDLKAAAAEWESAVALAETHHLDRERAGAEVGFGRVLNELGKHEDAHHWLALAGATLARIGGDPVLELRRDVYEGYDFWNEGKYADAVRVLEHAIARTKADHVDDPADAADAESFLGLGLVFYDDRFDEAVAHAQAAVTIDRDAYGPDHPYVGVMVSNLGIVEQEAGRLDEALAAVSQSLAIHQAALERGELSPQNQNLGNALLNTGIVLVRLGRAREAAALVERAAAIYRANDERDGLVNADTMLADSWRQLGRLSDAVRVAAEAQAAVDKSPDTSPEFLVELFVVEAWLALDQGKSDRALPIAERALTLAQSGTVHLYDQSKARLVLARALADGKRDPARARALAEQARAGFAKLHDRPRSDEAAAELAALP